ncbi:uncharacterized protein LOC133725985 [Rosa rugosa]|uniref:uncharacterized protein LOC133725985 n=1 Tax=Rosa rugosa TaxID=74645 RepID=UPI002B4010FA|nr:uncharacterized protein LOC133725985 [Rosa rugosa]XP_062009401.1 uncharacterized protein LOC133725985 [Rosa rugosa]XP_062009402.1 uncharacterized protein LOC133725985 [Rosa rugosa]
MEKTMVEESDSGVLEQPKIDHVVAVPIPIMEKIRKMMEKSDFGVIDMVVGEPIGEPARGPIPMMSNSRSFRPICNQNRAKLAEAWPMVKSSLEELGYSCTMSTVDSTVVVVSPWSTAPDMRKAVYLFKLLFKTPVPAPLALELALHGRQHDFIKIGTQKGGLCKKYGIKKEKFDKLRIRLKRSLKELGDMTHCTLFLNKSTLTAVGPSPRLHWVRKVLKFCTIEKLSPAHVIRVFNRKLKRKTAMMKNSDTVMMEKSDFGIPEQPKFNQEVGDPVPMLNSSGSFRPISNTNRAKLTEAWPMVKLSLEELGYSCAMSTVDSTVLVVPPCSTDPDIMRKANYLFQLLFKTPVLAPLAIELALHGRQHDLIKLGAQKGGICEKYGINKEKFDKLWKRLKRSLKELGDLTHCTLFLNKSTLTAVGPSPRLCWVRKVLKICITEELSPAHVIRVFNRKEKRTTTMMKRSDTMMMERSDSGVLEQPKFSQEVSGPVPLLNSRSFCPISNENQAKLREAWPMVKSSLEELGYVCAMSTVDSTVSLVLPWPTDPGIMHKADYLFKLLLKTPVPAPLAIELALFGRKHDLIKLGTQKGGICKKYGINKEKIDKLRRRLEHSLKELSDLTHCTLFLNKNTLTAVGPSPRLHLVRRVLEICIKRKISPADVISTLICKYDQKISFVRDLDVSNVKKTGHLMNKDGAAEVTLPFLERRATRMEGALSMVESSFEKYGISCTLNLIKRTVTISTTGATKEYPDAFEKARHLLQLLTTTNVPPSRAVELAMNGMKHEFIEIRFQEGGLCSLYGIKKEQYVKRHKWLIRSAKRIREFTGCDIYCTGDTITGVSPSLVGLSMFRGIVLTCIVEDTDPAQRIRKVLRSESKRKLKKIIKRLLV